MRFHGQTLAAVWVIGAAAAGAGASDRMFVSDYLTNRVYAYDAQSGASLGIFASGSGHLGELAIAPNGDLFCSSFDGNAVLHFNGTTGALVGTLTAPALSGPRGLAFGGDGKLYVSSAGGNAVLRFDPTSNAYLGTFATVGQPIGLAFGGNGRLYVASSSAASNNIQVLDATSGAIIGSMGTGLFNNPQSLAVGGDGFLYASSQYDFKLLRFNAATGAFDQEFYAGAYPFNPSAGLAFGPNGHLYTTSMTAGASAPIFWEFDGVGAPVSTFTLNPGNTWTNGLAFTPEPSTGMVALVGGMGLALRRRRSAGGR